LVITYLEYKDTKKFYERLRANYRIKHDFVIKRKIQKLQKGIRDAEYFLTFECFEKFVCYPEHQKVIRFVIILLH